MKTSLETWNSVCILCELCNLSISNFIFWLKGPTKKVCFGQNNWLLLVTQPDKAPIINYSILVRLPRPQWSLVNWQKPPSKPARQKSGFTGRPSLHASPPSRPGGSQVSEPQTARPLTPHRSFATFRVGCFFIKLWIVEQIVYSKNSWKQRKSVK